jgi:uncharacterized membrane protein
MEKNRLESFSDGVIAIIITIMVLELHVPQRVGEVQKSIREDMAELRPLLPIFLAYVLSYIYVGIYWNNHHHLLKAAKRVNGKMMWANLHLLFWLSLFPFVTGYVGVKHFTSLPTVLYGAVMLMAGVAYYILQKIIVAQAGPESRLAAAIGKDVKGKISVVLYACAIAIAFFQPWISCAIFVLVAIMWLVPDKRVERVVIEREHGGSAHQ